ncbi:MAG: RDD family protein [Acidimicrobiales bacterium]
MGSQLLTPEAVVLGFDTAGLSTRLLARLVDGTVQLILVIGTLSGLAFLSGAGVPDVGLLIAALFLLPLLLLGYPIAFEALWRGRTPGKAALGLRVVTVEGAPVRFRHALIRGGAEVVDLYGLGILVVAPGIVGAIAIAASARSQRLGDMVAGTLVVRERSGAPRATPAAFVVPWGYEAYAVTVDVSGIGARDYQAVRSYLLRAAGLRPEARRQVAAELGRAIAAGLRHVPPPDVSPDAFLAVVAANVQARGGGRPAAPVPAAVPGGWGAVPAWPSSGLGAPAPAVPVTVPEARPVSVPGSTGFAAPP